jgi:hypothetical protein
VRSTLLALSLVLSMVSVASAQSGDGAGSLGSPFGRSTGAAAPEEPVPDEGGPEAAPPTSGVAPAVVTPAGPTAPPSPPPPSYEGVAVPAPPGAAPIYSPQTAGLVGSTDVRIPSSIATRLRALDADLQILSLRGGGSIVDGILSILTGGVAITLGILLDTAPEAMRDYLYVYGAVGAVRGILSLSLMTNPSAAAIQYAHMPMGTTSQIRARLRYGESQLDSLADMARIGRILDGSLNIAAGLAVIPIFLGPTNFTFTTPFDYFVLIGAGISVVSGVITLFSSNESERRQSAYHELRDRLLATPEGAEDDEALEAAAEDAERASAVTVTPSIAVTPGGGFASVSGSF